MSKVYAVVSGKGGVGKTTTVANIGMALAMMGKKVCIVDLDVGLSKLDLVTGAESEVEYNIMDAIRGEVKISDALIKDRRTDNLYLLPTSQNDDEKDITPSDLKIIVNDLRKYFDFIFLDSPAGIGAGFRNVIADCDEAIIVVNPEISSIRDGKTVLHILENEGFVGKNIHLLVTRYRARMSLSGDMLKLEDVHSIYMGANRLGVIPEDSGVVISTNRGEPIVLQKFSKAGREYEAIARKITGELVEQSGAYQGLWNRVLMALTGSKIRSKSSM